MTRIFDCCMAFNELDMLELRFHTLNDVVDNFVVVEAGMTHSGQYKPQTVGAALATEPRFVLFADKIIYSYADTLDGDHSWTRERNHRAKIGDVLKYFAEPEDWVIVGDADEIANPDAVVKAIERGENTVLELDFYYYDFCNRLDMGWGIGMSKWREVQDANKIRACQFNSPPIRIPNAGWHLSYFSTPEQVAAKLDAFMHHADVAAHVPRDPAWIGERMRRGEDLFGRQDVRIERVPLSDTLPRYVLDNREQYAALGWLETDAVNA